MDRCLTRVNAAFVALCCALPLAMPRAVQAEPVIITTQGLPGIDGAQRDSTGTLRLFDADDVDGDGMISLVADLEPQRVLFHIRSGPHASHYMELIMVATPITEAIPFFITGTQDRVIAQWNSLPATAFTMGQPFSVAGGAVPGLDVVVYQSLGFSSAADIVDLDLQTLPRFTGPVQVGGLLQYEVIPEPSTVILLAAACCTWASLRFMRRRHR